MPIMVNDMELHPIFPGGWCVPAALQCLTGADLQSVIQPALNRHMQKDSLLELVTGASMSAATATLTELGYKVRKYKHPNKYCVGTWAKMSLTKYPGRALLVATMEQNSSHCLIIMDGNVYDTFTPLGKPGALHPYATAPVNWVALVEK